MEKQFVPTSASPTVIVDQVDGDLKLKGWDEQQVVVKNSSAEDIHLEQRGDEVSIRCTAGCSVRVPREASVQIKSVHGRTDIKGLDGALAVERVDGDMELRSVGPAAVQTVNGNLSAKNVFGDLTLGQVNGNLTVKDVQGKFTAQSDVNGNLQLDDVDGSASARVSGNILARFDPVPGATYDFTARGNIVLRMPSDASVALTIQCKGNRSVQLGDQRINQHGNEPYQHTFGDGDATARLAADGNVMVSSQAPDWEMGEFGADIDLDFEHNIEGMAEDMAASVSQQIEAQVAAITQQIEAQMQNLQIHLGGAGLSAEQAERIAQRAREASERASARAQEKMARTQEKFQRKLDAAQRRAEHRHRPQEHHGWNFNWASPPAPPAPPAEPVRDEERLAILHMLQEKKISLDQAEQLLNALEGK
jgi:hypothetical protein